MSIAPVLAYLTRWAKGGQPHAGVEKGHVCVEVGPFKTTRPLIE